jgi:hypothetical protein
MPCKHAAYSLEWWACSQLRATIISDAHTCGLESAGGSSTSSLFTHPSVSVQTTVGHVFLILWHMVDYNPLPHDILAAQQVVLSCKLQIQYCLGHAGNVGRVIHKKPNGARRLCTKVIPISDSDILLIPFRFLLWNETHVWEHIWVSSRCPIIILGLYSRFMSKYFT